MSKDDERTPTPEEAALWEAVTRHDAPIKPRKSKKKPPAPTQQKSLPMQDSGFAITLAPSTPKRSTRQQERLEVGALQDMDGRTAERLRKGRYPIDAVLDLHGLTQEKALIQLQQFLAQHLALGSRCVLIITGKGARSSQAGGVLRSQLPNWLNLPQLRPAILAMTPAQPRDGGSGAFYVLLRRSR